MIEALITSKTRLKLLLKFFLNPSNTSYLRGLATEFSESTNSVRVELNRLEEAEMLESFSEGNKKLFKVNTAHPLFVDIQAIIKKYVGIDTIIENILNRIGNLEEVYLVGDIADGKSSDKIELLMLGDLDETYLKNLVDKAQQVIHKEIIYTVQKKNPQNINGPHLKIWSA
ncbi:hypothetical protein [Flammeovirga pacifica]|uniref:Transcriptional regulator n=1 Tax=Flammeovirga pacifica TaxID=915059 RepID=A0A1S1YVB9_FLAPC|nr:hypothetical protein [Flammeovirga pacifica]OHX64950.1 transcriptional regulator [Flammeovirga pacifica]